MRCFACFACLALLASTACSSAENELVLTDSREITAPPRGSAAPLGDREVFHHHRPLGCRAQRSPLTPTEGERQRFEGLIDSVRAIAKQAATDVVPANRSH